MKEKLEKMGFRACGPLPNERQMEWYPRGRTALLHFGMNTFMGNEWGDGSEAPKLFAPTELDCRQLIRVLKEEGFDPAIDWSYRVQIVMRESDKCKLKRREVELYYE